MSAHQYTCPKCGVSLQSGQDVAGRKVRCLGCMNVFVAGGNRETAAANPAGPRAEHRPIPLANMFPHCRKATASR